jgi:hypothetical protein
VGGGAYGIIGALIALPLAAVVRETVVYLRRHLILEPWGAPAQNAGGGTSPLGGTPALAPARRDQALDPPAVPPCPRCGADVSPADAFCRRCGHDLDVTAGR